MEIWILTCATGLEGTADTSAAAGNAVQNRPQADDRGVISYPNYQVVVARTGDTPSTIAGRLGLDGANLARFNGMQPNDTLRAGEILALPQRVSEPTTATGAVVGGPIQPLQVDVTTLASNTINQAEPTPVIESASASAATIGTEPTRHRVERGETAFIISRLYGISPRALAEWNGLDSDFSIREGQVLLIPPMADGSPSVPQTPSLSTNDTTVPGQGTATPTPPSAVTPLPVDDIPSVAETQTQTTQTAPAAPVADIGQSAQTSGGTMQMPVNGSIIRAYTPGKNEGIDISAPAGATVSAAASGQVAAVTTNSENVLIVVIKHSGDLLSVYTHLDNLTVKKGDAVSKGQSIGKVLKGDPSFVHFEVRQGFDSVDPLDYLN